MICEKIVTSLEAAEILGLSDAQVRFLCRKGDLKGAEKIGRAWLIPRENVERYTRVKPGPKKNKDFLKKILDKF